MNPIIILIIVGFLLVILFTIVTLVLAVRHSAHGYEDEAGFHRTPEPQTAGLAALAQGSDNPWDYVPGANCPLKQPD